MIIRLSDHLHGLYSLCNFVHRHLNKAHSLTGKKYLAIMALCLLPVLKKFVPYQLGPNFNFITIRKCRSGGAVSTDTVDGWVRLRDMTDISCLAIPEECNFGVISGVTVLLLVKFDNCGNDNGIMSTYKGTFCSGFALRCSRTNLR